MKFNDKRINNLKMELENLAEFKSTPEIREKLAEYGISKRFAEGDVILRENAYINSIPIVTSGSTNRTLLRIRKQKWSSL